MSFRRCDTVIEHIFNVDIQSMRSQKNHHIFQKARKIVITSMYQDLLIER